LDASEVRTCPHSTDERAIGIEWNLSKLPLCNPWTCIATFFSSVLLVFLYHGHVRQVRTSNSQDLWMRNLD